MGATARHAQEHGRSESEGRRRDVQRRRRIRPTERGVQSSAEQEHSARRTLTVREEEKPQTTKG